MADSLCWWPAPAKVNRFLHILGRRPDGYHVLQTLFQFLDLQDALAFEPTRDGRIELLEGPDWLADEDNLVIRAAHRLREAVRQPRLGAVIRLKKRIPAGGGLGGGSSDAATTLVALNRLWQTGLTRRQLMDLGLALGADVPVFIYGRAAFAEGVGERLQPVFADVWSGVLVDPGVAVSTAEIFSDPALTRDSNPSTIRHLSTLRWRNDCEPAVRKRFKQVDQVMRYMSRWGKPVMTGTGACVFMALPAGYLPEMAAGLPKGSRHWPITLRNYSPLLERLK